MENDNLKESSNSKEDSAHRPLLYSSNFESTPNIFMWIPNILDYLRVIFVIIGFFVGKTHPIMFLFTYFISFSLDLFDGMAARHFDQCSRLGATLDMVL